MTYRQFPAVAIATVSMAFLFPFPVACSRNAPPNGLLINIPELNQLQIIGRLGQPLGTGITIEGLVADEKFVRTKADLGHTILRVQAVNGSKLSEEQVFHFRPVSDRVIEPQDGRRFKFFGYETGGFTGVPSKVFDGIASGTPYRFTTDFVIVREVIGQK